jgi:hypothetical protein
MLRAAIRAPLGPGRDGRFLGVRTAPVERSSVLWGVALTSLLIVEGYAVTRSLSLAGLMLAALAVALAARVPLVPVLGASLAARVLTSASFSSLQARYSTSLSPSSAIAVLFILIAVGLVLHRRRQVRAALVVTAWLCLFTFVAIGTHGDASLTFREGVREASIAAVAAIVWNSRGALSVAVAVRVVQFAGIGSALVALYQLATHSGMDIGGHIRSNGTFTHPNGAAMYFAIGTVASLWHYLEHGRHRLDAALTATFAAAAISTFSVGGLVCMLVMLLTLGAMRPGPARPKLAAVGLAACALAAFAASPVGASRLAGESTTSLSSAQFRGAANTSLAWRFYKWHTLLPLWRQAPLLGQGLGTTVTAEATSENDTAGKVPHNEYVRYLVETGALGLLGIVFAIGLVARRLIRFRGMRGTRNSAGLALSVLLGSAVNGLGDNTLLYSTTGYAAVLIIAAALVELSSTASAEHAR